MQAANQNTTGEQTNQRSCHAANKHYVLSAWVCKLSAKVSFIVCIATNRCRARMFKIWLQTLKFWRLYKTLKVIICQYTTKQYHTSINKFQPFRHPRNSIIARSSSHHYSLPRTIRSLHSSDHLSLWRQKTIAGVKAVSTKDTVLPILMDLFVLCPTVQSNVNKRVKPNSDPPLQPNQYKKCTGMISKQSQRETCWTMN